MLLDAKKHIKKKRKRKKKKHIPNSNGDGSRESDSERRRQRESGIWKSIDGADLKTAEQSILEVEVSNSRN